MNSERNVPLYTYIVYVSISTVFSEFLQQCLGHGSLGKNALYLKTFLRKILLNLTGARVSVSELHASLN